MYNVIINIKIKIIDIINKIFDLYLLIIIVIFLELWFNYLNFQGIIYFFKMINVFNLDLCLLCN